MATNIQTIKNFPQLIKYLRTDLGWPVDEEDADNLTFDYDAEELGLDKETAVKVRGAKQLRPLVSGQLWGIFWIDFEPKKLPVTVMRRILNQLVAKKRGGKSQQATWNLDDLLFISAVGSEKSDGREITFAHFHQEDGDLPTLRVLGWDGADTVLKIDYVAKTLKEKLLWPQNPKDVVRWRETWAEAFKHKPGYVIKTADALAARLAELARNIRAAAKTIMTHETERGRLRKLHKAFQTALIHDLREEDFADTYAQTITYGLLTAAISRTDMSGGMGTALVAENITDMVPVTNPFLKEMLQTFLQAGGRNRSGVDFDELGIQDVVELLRSDETDLPAILRDFNNRAEGEDPVIRFYEDFLAAYDKALKVQRGVFYTPKPVVSYIVRGVHELLQSEFGLADGLADTSTWDALRLRSGLTIPKGVDPNSFFVTILDPATGTATFLVEVIDVIYKTMTAKWKKQGKSTPQIQTAWNEYVPQSLLPRLYGYELMMAPYAIAHMKIGLKLYETGYRFASEQRANIYLTNALEEPSQLAQGSAASLFEALGHELQAVNDVKRSVRFTVVIGNPPYAGISSNNNRWVENLLRTRFEDGADSFFYFNNAPLREPNTRWLNDDYVKFLRLAQFLITNSKVGIVGMITNHSWLENPTFRGMRQSISTTFNKIYLLDAHGNTKKGDVSPDGSKDENLFDIQQGVAISLLSTAGRNKTFYHNDLFGIRPQKYQWLVNSSITNTNWSVLSPDPDLFLWKKFDGTFNTEYKSYYVITDIFSINGDDGRGNSWAKGLATTKDHLYISFERNEAIDKIALLAGAKESDKVVAEILDLVDSPYFKTSNVRKAIRKGDWMSRICDVSYRPFDTRILYWHPELYDVGRGASSKKVMRQLFKSNLALITSRMTKGEEFAHAFVSRQPVEVIFLSSKTSNNAFVFPLKFYPDEGNQLGLGFDYGSVNLNPKFKRDVANKLKLNVDKDNAGEEIFYYIYAILYSLTYRSRYAEFLKIDFPRLPLTSNVELFRQLCGMGKELVALHLLEASVLNKPITKFKGKGDNVVAKGHPKYEDGVVLVNPSQGFEGIPEDVWEFHIGGYQVCEKWLKDRRGRELSAEDIEHYGKVVVALKETIRLMGEVDRVIEVHGGWPVM